MKDDPLQNWRAWGLPFNNKPDLVNVGGFNHDIRNDQVPGVYRIE